MMVAAARVGVEAVVVAMEKPGLQLDLEVGLQSRKRPTHNLAWFVKS